MPNDVYACMSKILKIYMVIKNEKQNIVLFSKKATYRDMRQDVGLLCTGGNFTNYTYSMHFSVATCTLRVSHNQVSIYVFLM